MKKVIVTLMILTTSTLFCTQESTEHLDSPSALQTAKSEGDLIVSHENLDFSKHKVTFIELGADKCIPCKAMQPVIREIAKDYVDVIQVVFYDVWKTPKFAGEYGVKMIPTQIFFDKNGNEVFRHVGFYAKEDILKMLKEKGIL